VPCGLIGAPVTWGALRHVPKPTAHGLDTWAFTARRVASYDPFTQEIRDSTDYVQPRSTHDRSGSRRTGNPDPE